MKVLEMSMKTRAKHSIWCEESKKLISRRQAQLHHREEQRRYPDPYAGEEIGYENVEDLIDASEIEVGNED